MMFPFQDELNDLFRQNRSIWWKMLGGAAATPIALLVAGIRQPPTVDLSPATIVIALVVAAVIGAGLAILLSLKDVVVRRQAAGQRVSWLLQVYFAKGRMSLLVWGVTAVVASFPIMIVLLGYLGL